MGEAVAALLGQARIGREVRGLPTSPSSAASPSGPSGLLGQVSIQHGCLGFQARAVLQGSRLGRGTCEQGWGSQGSFLGPAL